MNTQNTHQHTACRLNDGLGEHSVSKFGTDVVGRADDDDIYLCSTNGGSEQRKHIWLFVRANALLINKDARLRRRHHRQTLSV